MIIDMIDRSLSKRKYLREQTLRVPRKQRYIWNTRIIAQHFSNENRRFFYRGFPQMNVDNVDNVESTWRIKLCATAKNGEISYIIAKNMKNRQNIM